jgi:hypothetical protein
MVHLSAVGLTFASRLNKPITIVCTATEPRNVWSDSCDSFIPNGRNVRRTFTSKYSSFTLVCIRHYAASRKVACSKLDEVNAFFKFT